MKILTLFLQFYCASALAGSPSVGFFALFNKPPVNVALSANGGTAISSSDYNPGYAPAATNDGERSGANWGSGGGWNDGTNSSFPDYLEINFSSNKSISEIDVFTVQDNYNSPSTPTPVMTFTLYGLVAFQAQYWSGTTWVDVPGGNITGNTNVWIKIGFPAISTDRIRIKTNNAADGIWSRITEVEAWGQ